MLCGDTNKIMRKKFRKRTQIPSAGQKQGGGRDPAHPLQGCRRALHRVFKGGDRSGNCHKTYALLCAILPSRHALLDPLVRVFRDRYHLAFLLVIYLSQLSPPFPRPRRIPTALAPPPAHSPFATPDANLLSPHCSPIRSTNFLLPLPSPFAAVRTWEISSSLAPVTDRIRPPHSLKVPQQRFEEKAHYKYHKQNADHDPLL